MASVTLENITQDDLAEPDRAPGRIRNLCIEIPDNEFLVFLGPPSSGKSAILRMIAGLAPLAGGSISIGDKNVTAVPPKDREIAMLFPSDTLLPHLTVRKNLAVGLSLRKLTKAEADRRVDHAADLLDLGPVLELTPDALTPAQRLMAAIGRAVAQQPKVILFDDVLSLLAPQECALMRPALIRLHQHLRATMIHATRNPHEAMALGTRLVVLGGGIPATIEQAGSPHEIYSRPANRFVAGLTSLPPMNFLSGVLRKDGEQIVFKEPSGGTLEIRLGCPPAATGWIGKEVVLGLRPEDCEILPAGKTSQENAFQVLADTVETFGAETRFHADTGAHKLLISSRSPADQVASGHRIRILIDAAHALLFDPSNGKAIR